MKETFRGIKIFIAIVIVALIISGFVYLFNINEVEARSGCCSWHGGVCTYKCPDGVNVGYMCCDGTSLSAKCAPYYPKCPPISTPKCPSHSTYNSSSGSCECNYGYIASGGECIDVDIYCYDKYGSHSSYDILLKDCKCDYGYTLIDDKCTKPEPIEEYPPAKEQSTKEPAIEEEPPDKEQSSEQLLASQKDLPVPEKLTAEIPKDVDRGSVWGWIIGLGILGYLFYVFKIKKKKY